MATIKKIIDLIGERIAGEKKYLARLMDRFITRSINRTSETTSYRYDETDNLYAKAIKEYQEKAKAHRMYLRDYTRSSLTGDDIVRSFGKPKANINERFRKLSVATMRRAVVKPVCMLRYLANLHDTWHDTW